MCKYYKSHLLANDFTFNLLKKYFSSIKSVLLPLWEYKRCIQINVDFLLTRDQDILDAIKVSRVTLHIPLLIALTFIQHGIPSGNLKVNFIFGS